MKKTILLSAAVACTLVSCNEKKEEKDSTIAEKGKTYENIQKAEWFLGKWGNASAEGELTENWVKVNDSVMHGESYFVVGGKDTVFAETVELAEHDGKMGYTVTVPGQNEEKPVRFEMTSATGEQLVFENPQHDYPNKIIYNKVGNDSIVAEISGTKQGKPASEKFKMKKRN